MERIVANHSYSGNQDPAVLTRTWSDQEAYIIVDLLHAHGIEAWTNPGERPATILPQAVNEIDVIVSELDLEDAACIVAEHSDALLQEIGN